MDYRLELEARLVDHYCKAGDIDRESWKKPGPVPRYRVTLAKLLVALATRIAPTVTMPSASTHVMAR